MEYRRESEHPLAVRDSAYIGLCPVRLAKSGKQANELPQNGHNKTGIQRKEHALFRGKKAPRRAADHYDNLAMSDVRVCMMVCSIFLANVGTLMK